SRRGAFQTALPKNRRSGGRRSLRLLASRCRRSCTAIRFPFFDLLGFHLVNFTVQSSPADSKFLRRGGHISVRRRERLHDEPLLGLVKIERARFFAKRFG